MQPALFHAFFLVVSEFFGALNLLSLSTRVPSVISADRVLSLQLFLLLVGLVGGLVSVRLCWVLCLGLVSGSFSRYVSHVSGGFLALLCPLRFVFGACFSLPSFFLLVASFVAPPPPLFFSPVCCGFVARLALFVPGP